MKLKKIISIMLTIAMVMGIVPSVVGAENATNETSNPEVLTGTWTFDNGETWEQLTAMTVELYPGRTLNTWTNTVTTEGSIVSVENGRLAIGGETAACADLYFPRVYPNGGIVKLSFDMQPSAAGMYLQGVGSAFFPQFNVRSDGTLLMYATKNSATGKVISDFTKTYNFEVIYDFSDGSYAWTVSLDGAVVNQFTLEQAETAGKTGCANMGDANISHYQFYSNADATNKTKTYIDNIKVEYYIPELTISEENVTIYEGTVAQSDLTAVSPDADKIEIDMGAAPDMTACEGKITLKAGETPVAFTGSADGNKYIMTLADGALSESTEYTITLAEGVKTTDGATLLSAANITFTTTSSEVAADAATTILDWNFDGLTLESLISDDADKDRIRSFDVNVSTTTHEVSNNELVAKTSNGTANTRVTLAQNKHITTTDLGRIKVSADVKTNGQVAALGLVGNAFLPNLQLSTNVQVIQNSSLIGQGGNISGSDWYSIYVIYDFDENNIIYGYGKKGASATEGTISGKLSTETYTKINGIILNAWKSDSTVTTDVQWDNLKLEYDAPTPFVGEEDISILCADTVEPDMNDISPVADEIVIDFNSTMKANSFEDAVTLQNITDSTMVSFTGTMSKTKYTMQLTNNLQANKEYKLTVSKTVKNIKNVSLDDDVTYTFKTGAGKVDLELSAIKQSNTTVTDFESLTSGAGTVDIVVRNTTGASKNVIMLCNSYSGNELKQCVVYDVEISADAVNTTISEPIVVQDLTDIDCVKVLLWDGFDTITPLSKAIVHEKTE